MATQKYSVTQVPISTLISWVNSGEIAIPEIQRPFVWDSTKVRNFLDSLLQGYPVGYLITWRSADIKLKDGSISIGKRILIDGQQRVGALMASLLAYEIVTKEYARVRIRIAFQPVERRFEVSNSAIAKDFAWIPDIATVFDPRASLYQTVDNYCRRNPDSSPDTVFQSLERLRQITNNQIGLIELDSQLDIETVTEIFIRVNSEGVTLNQADFAMSKIAVNETYDGTNLRKAIDYFCHLAVAPEFYSTLEKNDRDFAKTDYFAKMVWLKKQNDDLYNPSYPDMLRVAFTSQFRRGHLQDLVALLSGRNFETKDYEETIVQDTFTRLREGVMRFMSETHFSRFIMIIRSAGFVNASMIGSQNTLNFAYILYLILRHQKERDADIERYVRRWFVMSVLSERYSAGSAESKFDFDIRQIDAQGIAAYSDATIQGTLSEAYWDITLPQQLDRSASSPYFHVFLAAQVKLGDRAFLSQDISVRDLIEAKAHHVHHLFPRDYLKKNGLTRSEYNQIANYTIAQSEINIDISNKEPAVYFKELIEQCNGGPKRYGNITSMDVLRENFRMNCIPDGIECMTFSDYPAFLAERRKLMAHKIKAYFQTL